MKEAQLTDEQLDRAAGVLLAQACGDALGVPYEFEPPMPRDDRAAMEGSGVFAPAEWSDDTQMALCIADALRDTELGSEAMYDCIAELFLAWTSYACDIGIQIGAVLADAGGRHGSPRRRCWDAARAFTDGKRPTGGAGNGALMRTGIVALACPRDRERTAELVREIAALTHAHEDVEGTCVLWAEAVRHAVLRDWRPGDLLDEAHLLAGLDLIAPERRARCEAWVRESTGVEPWTIGRNGYTVTALRAAWAAITWSQAHLEAAPGAGPRRFVAAGLDAAVHAGWDTDTVAAIAGQLLGARWGASAVPAQWRAAVWGRAPGAGGTGYEKRVGEDLVRLAEQVARKGTQSR